MSRRAAAQPSLMCDGMASARIGENMPTSEETIADIFALWVDRIADVRSEIEHRSGLSG